MINYNRISKRNAKQIAHYFSHTSDPTVVPLKIALVDSVTGKVYNNLSYESILQLFGILFFCPDDIIVSEFDTLSQILYSRRKNEMV